MRMAMRRSLGNIWFICATASRIAAAQRVASTTLSNSISTNSPVCLKMVPPNSGISGSMISVRKLLSPAKLSFSSPGNSRV
jgi:hypothetical protein